MPGPWASGRRAAGLTGKHPVSGGKLARVYWAFTSHSLFGLYPVPDIHHADRAVAREGVEEISSPVLEKTALAVDRAAVGQSDGRVLRPEGIDRKA